MTSGLRPGRRPAFRAVSRAAIRAGASLLLLASLRGVSPAEWPPWMTKKETKPPVYPEIAVDAEWARRHEDGVLAIDTRDAAAYRGGHLPGAISFPLAGEEGPAGPDLGGARRLLAEAGGGTIVCYGASGDPARPARLFWLLELAGGEKIRFLDGGFEAWERSGQPIDSLDREPGPRPAEPPVPARVDSTRLATLLYTSERFGRDSFEVIDLRDSAAWRGDTGKRKGAAPARRGHIPHALPFDARSVIEKDGTFLAGPDIRSLFARVGPRSDTRIDLESEMILCDDGRSGESALAYLLLRIAGVEKLRRYPGGFAEWAADPALPVVRVVGAKEVEDRLDRSRRAKKEADRFLLFDVREKRDFEIGHVPGAVCIPSHQFEDSLDVVLERLAPGLDRSTAALGTYCYGTDCIRSRMCATLAARAGFRGLLWFHGGIVEWKEERLPVDGKFGR